VPNDSVPIAFPDFGPAFLPALAGAGFEYDGRTTWSVPVTTSIRELRVKAFDPKHPLWRKFLERFRPLLRQWSWQTYLPSASVMVGPMDILAGLLGPETLAMEMIEQPEEVERCATEASELFLQVLAVQVAMLRDSGLSTGMADWMLTWLPGTGVCYSEDFAALCGPGHFSQFFIKANSRIMSRLDSAYLHLHSAALQNLPAVLQLRGLRALELSNDPSGPDLDSLIPAAQAVQAAGLPLQFSNWQRPLRAGQIRRLLQELDPAGLKITLQAASVEEAHELYAFCKSAPQVVTSDA
jgi:hypothetical protein